ncbi:MAG: BolA/IbaG family iron-sulfur metabolism protein [Glaciecola sp.]|jgi:BolA protein
MKIQNQITEKLLAAFSPIHLSVENESRNHNVPPGSESHFKVTIVSEAFVGKRLLPCHRLVNEVLAEELANDIHALAIHTYAPDKWQGATSVPVSPKCMGGDKRDR